MKGKRNESKNWKSSFVAFYGSVNILPGFCIHCRCLLQCFRSLLYLCLQPLWVFSLCSRSSRAYSLPGCSGTIDHTCPVRRTSHFLHHSLQHYSLYELYSLYYLFYAHSNTYLLLSNLHHQFYQYRYSYCSSPGRKHIYHYPAGTWNLICANVGVMIFITWKGRHSCACPCPLCGQPAGSPSGQCQ